MQNSVSIVLDTLHANNLRLAQSMMATRSRNPAASPEIDRPNQMWCADITYIPVTQQVGKDLVVCSRNVFVRGR